MSCALRLYIAIDPGFRLVVEVILNDLPQQTGYLHKHIVHNPIEYSFLNLDGNAQRFFIKWLLFSVFLDICILIRIQILRLKASD